MNSTCATATLRRQMRAILFMDTVRYSELEEVAAVQLAESLWNYVAEAVAASGGHVLDANTWGDGVLVVTDCAEAAAQLALHIRGFFSETNLTRLQLPLHLTCRISLHAGDVSIAYDPVRKRNAAIGTEVNRCARAEPITDPGQIFMTLAFVQMLGISANADAVAEPTTDPGQIFVTRPFADLSGTGTRAHTVKEIGVRELAKRFGAHMLYSLDPRPIVKAGVSPVRVKPEVHEGFTTPERLRKSTHRLPGENFTVELLSQPVVVERAETGALTVTISRVGVTEVVISNEAKSYAVRNYVTGTNGKALVALDQNLQRFLSGGRVDEGVTCKGDNRETLTVNLAELGTRLRWASGGVLSVVTRDADKSKWVPMFFRDIRPFGWNISLGQSERQFDRTGRWETDKQVFDAELMDPAHYIEREFLEETVVLSRRPSAHSAQRTPLKMAVFSTGATADTRRYVEHYHKDYWSRRHAEDGILIEYGRRIEVTKPRLHAKITVAHKSESGITEHVSEPDVLVCFSLLDLGIEVVKVYEYSLDEDECFLDGEVLFNRDGSSDLIKMPMALLSCKYLTEVFGDRNWQQKYTSGPGPSILASRAPNREEVILFDWDVEQRMKVVRGETDVASSFQRDRFVRWYDMFGGHFVDEDGKLCQASLPRLFVPGTAKILNLYLSRTGTPMPFAQK